MNTFYTFYFITINIPIITFKYISEFEQLIEKQRGPKWLDRCRCSDYSE